MVTDALVESISKNQSTRNAALLGSLTLDQQARIYMLFKNANVRYIPWKNDEAELEAAYQPLPVIPWTRMLHQSDLDYKEFDIWEPIYTRLDEDQTIFYQPELTQQEKDITAFAKYLITEFKSVHTSTDKYLKARTVDFEYLPKPVKQTPVKVKSQSRFKDKIKKIFS
jgi:hypothetical protein